MKRIYTAANPVVAHMVRGLLESYGIESEVHGEELFSVRGELPMVGDTFPTVWLNDTADYERARKVIEEFDRRMSEHASDDDYWQCSGCGEEHEMQFTSCWNCGRQRSA